MKRTAKITDHFLKVSEKMINNPILISIRRGFVFVMPVVLVGSIALVVLSLPIQAYQNFMATLFGNKWESIFLYVRDGTFNIFSLLVVIAISYSYVAEIGERNSFRVSPIVAAIVSLCSFVAISGMSTETFKIANFGVIGLFMAITVAIISSMLFLKLSSLKFLKIKAFSNGANSDFSFAINSFFPAIIIITFFAILNYLLITFFGIANIQSFISESITDLFSNIKSPFWSGILFISLIHIFWFFGMHGSNILEPVAQSIFIPALATNQLMIELGQAPTEIFTKTFFDVFVLMGGCGTLLSLIMAILIIDKNKSQRQLVKVSLIPVLFNINELIIFGIPIVLNPVYIIPFIFVPLILTVFSYLLIWIGLVPYTTHLVEWTTPVFLSGYVATGSIRGSILQLFNLALGTLLYIPFVKLGKIVSDKQGKDNLQRLITVYRQCEESGQCSTLLSRNDVIGNISRLLAADLEDDLQNNKLILFYQPQVDYAGNITGVEALLRWQHEYYGYIYPPLVIALAEESQIIDKLGYWIVKTACRELENLVALGCDNLIMSINISVMQLENEFLVETLHQIVENHNIRHDSLEIEITEQLALSNNPDIIERIKSIKKLGFRLALDDYGKGHSSLVYIKEYDFDTIKIDGSLVQEILNNNNCGNIISSIVFLAESLHCSVIAEYVENEEQRNALHNLRCDYYQGYFFSEPLPENDLIKYIQSKKHNK